VPMDGEEMGTTAMRDATRRDATPRWAARRRASSR